MTPGTNSPVHDAAVNAVAVASLAYQRELMAFTTILACARDHGLDVDELCDASGFDQAFINRLIEEAA